ncbi:chitinase 1-like [Ananas comosus]|uniref:Chitinase 1-like n=2 Tax=Ananas comosus TaxID=4615 RepID=A0A6P5GK28_ANACO|nr:chitinase 1-like [Ananas comosus]
MMEYIGATGAPISFSEVPIDPAIDFNFLLGFAIDADASGKPQNGVFSPYWTSTLTPQSVRDTKTNHSNVKVLASLSGWSVNNKVLSWYNPIDTRSWIFNAFTSLQTLIAEYSLDGIDIDYENFPKNDATFAFCIGELITMLKNHSVITVATIAPYYRTVSHYVDLYLRYGSVIDYVNHQFYTDRVRLPIGYLNDFRTRAKQFNATKLLPSYEVNGRGIQGEAFFEALKLLEDKGFDVNGVMIFSADASISNSFYYERRAQGFLLNSTFQREVVVSLLD